MATITKVTLLDLVQAVSDFSTSDAETVATVAYLVNSGKVRLCGNFAGARIDLAMGSSLPFQRSCAPVDALRNPVRTLAQ